MQRLELRLRLELALPMQQLELRLRLQLALPMQHLEHRLRLQHLLLSLPLVLQLLQQLLLKQPQ